MRGGQFQSSPWKLPRLRTHRVSLVKFQLTVYAGVCFWALDSVPLISVSIFKPVLYPIVADGCSPSELKLLALSSSLFFSCVFMSKLCHSLGGVKLKLGVVHQSAGEAGCSHCSPFSHQGNNPFHPGSTVRVLSSAGLRDGRMQAK